MIEGESDQATGSASHDRTNAGTAVGASAETATGMRAADPRGVTPDDAQPEAAGPAKTRKPWIWTPPDIPTWKDLVAGPERRRAFFRYWRANGASWALEITLHHVFRLLPTEACSSVGAWIGRVLGPRVQPNTAIGARRNLKRIHPDWSDERIERAVISHYENGGRLMTEFSVLHRLKREGRIAVEGAEDLMRVRRAGPTILVCCHTGNWEVMFPVLSELGFDWSINYTPPHEHARDYVAREVRTSFGAGLLPPGKAGTRPAIRLLEAGGAVSIYCDETHERKVMAPFFDRPPHLDGNLAIAVRMKRMTGARICVYNCTRVEGARFKVRFQAPIDLPSDRDPKAPLIDDVIALNAVIEPIVLAHSDQWFFLDNRFE